MRLRVVISSVCLFAGGCGDQGENGSDAGLQPPDSPDAEAPSPLDASLDASTEPTLPEEVARIVTVLNRAMYECPDRVWPGQAEFYRRSQVLLAAPSTGKAYLWNDQAAMGTPLAVTTLDSATLAPEWLQFFNVGSLDDHPTLGVSLDLIAEVGGEELAKALIVHEAFHFLGVQTEWPEDPAGTRASPYPEPWQPRYLRIEVLGRLRHVLEETPGSELGGPAFFEARLQAEHASAMQAILGTDVAEGTAEYATVISLSLGEVGCEADEDALQTAARSHVDGFVDVESVMIFGEESYALGVAAGLLLRAGPAGWESRVDGSADGNTRPLVTVLLDGVAAEAQAEDADLVAQVQAAVSARNSEVAAEVEPLLSQVADPSFHRLVLPYSWLAGAFSTGGFVSLVEEPGSPEVILSFGGLFISPGGVMVEVDGQPALDLTNPCAFSPAWVVTLPATSVTAGATSGTLSAATSTLSFTSLSATIMTAADGLSWICPTP